MMPFLVVLPGKGFFLCAVDHLDALLVQVSDILRDHELCAMTHALEEQDMQREERGQNVSEGVRMTAEPPAEHADATPLVQTSTGMPQNRLTRRELARRRRQRLLELLQHQGKPPTSR
jgi:hypothetical protein